MKASFNYINLFLILIFPELACKKFVQIAPPTNLVVTATVFQNDQTAISAVVGLYSKIMGNSNVFLNGATTIYPALTADEIKNVSPGTDDEFYSNAISTNNAIVETYFWDRSYSNIYQINSCIESLAASTGVTPVTKNQLLGEVKFMRALCYFYLINLFGDVPLITSTDYASNATFGRTATSAIYEQIQKDLWESQSLLSVNYPSTGKFRPNKWTATSLLARVYLYNKNWIGADSAASAVIASNTYTLAGLDNVFLINSSETIWQMAAVAPNINTTEGYYFLPFTAGTAPLYTINSNLLNAFESTDLRKTHWIKSTTVAGVTYNYPYKYRVLSTPVNSEANIVFRLAEIYLIRAEARAEQGNIGTALTDLNIVRTRSVPSNATASDITAFRTILLHERQVEFFAEFGHRWLDLKRSGTMTAVLGLEKTSWKSSDSLFPIPINQIIYNKNLTQNNGYN